MTCTPAVTPLPLTRRDARFGVRGRFSVQRRTVRSRHRVIALDVAGARGSGLWCTCVFHGGPADLCTHIRAVRGWLRHRKETS